MSKLLTAMLFLATLTAAFKETIKIHGPDDHDTVNKLYQAFGGSWNLSSLGIEGFEQAAISELHFFPPLASNSTGYNTSSISNSRKRLVYPNVKTPSCYDQYNGHYSLFTLAQQKWITETVCAKFLQSLTPYTFAGVGMVVTGVGCTSITNSFLKWTCSAVVTMGVTAGGVYFQPAWANVCNINFQAIENACGQGGGAVQSDFYTTTISRNGQGVGYTAVSSTLSATGSLDETLSGVCSTVGNTYCKTMECTAAVCTG